MKYNYYKELEKFKKNENYLYILDNKDESNQEYNDKKKIYIETIKKNLLYNIELKEYYLEDIPEEIREKFTFNEIEFPLFVIKENNGIIKFKGINEFFN